LGKPFVTDCETETDLKSNIVFGEIPRFLLQRPTEEFINIKNNSVDIVFFFFYSCLIFLRS